jgi:hypothetical protein
MQYVGVTGDQFRVHFLMQLLVTHVCRTCMSLWQHSSLLEVIGIKPFALPFIPLDVLNSF